MVGLAFALKQHFGLDFDFSEVHGRDGIEMYVWDALSTNFADKKASFDDLEAEQKEQDDEAAAALDISFGDEDDEDLGLFEEQIRNQYLRSIDRNWRAHLQAMEQMRDSIGLQGYAQKDPKKEYKRKGYDLFMEMMFAIKTNVVEFISKSEGESIDALLPRPSSRPTNLELNREGSANPNPSTAADAKAPNEEPKKIELPKVGRNDPCPCGSGKKYKNCHMRKKRKDNPRRKRVSAN